MFADVVAELETFGLPYLHIGGDEVDLTTYTGTKGKGTRFDLEHARGIWAKFDRRLRNGSALASYRGTGSISMYPCDLPSLPVK